MLSRIRGMRVSLGSAEANLPHRRPLRKDGSLVSRRQVRLTDPRLYWPGPWLGYGFRDPSDPDAGPISSDSNEAGDDLARILHHGGEGRGFSPPLKASTRLFQYLARASLQMQAAAGEILVRVRSPFANSSLRLNVGHDAGSPALRNPYASLTVPLHIFHDFSIAQR